MWKVHSFDWVGQNSDAGTGGEFPQNWTFSLTFRSYFSLLMHNLISYSFTSLSNFASLHQHHMGAISKACISPSGVHQEIWLLKIFDFGGLFNPFNSSKFPISPVIIIRWSVSNLKFTIVVYFSRIVMDDKKLACPLRHNCNPSNFCLISYIWIFLGMPSW